MSRLDPAAVRARKDVLRSRLLANRRALRPADLVAEAERLTARLLSAPEVAEAAIVAAYVAVGSEPGTGLLDALAGRGKQVLLPVLAGDGDLDWSVYLGVGSLAAAHRGLIEPVGSRLGTGAVGRADVVLCPALCVDGHGHRLGRGGGSYDRALARVAARTWVCALVYDDEIVESVPVESHDRRVDAAASPDRLVRMGASRPC